MGASGKRKRDETSDESTHMPPTPSIPRALTTKPPLILSNESVLRAAMQHLSQDTVMKPIVAEHGLPRSLIAKPNRSCFHALAQTIVYQQLSIKAARPIFQRVMTACKVEPIAGATMPPAADDPEEDEDEVFESASKLTPAAVLAADMDVLRGAGLSNNKARFLIDLAQHFDDGRLSDEALTSPSASPEELSNMLQQVKGVGPWSVTMFQLFHLGHADVLPLGDLGVRRGLAHLYNIKDDKDTAAMQQVTQAWAPYRSVGSWCVSW